MTNYEAQIARIAFYLGMQAAEEAKGNAPHVISNFVNTYDPNRPCHHRVECVLTGRCPRDPVCNN